MIIGAMPGRVSSPLFVGRRAELDRLRESLDVDSAVSRRATLVGGEAGVGKTRLVTEFGRAAEADGIRVLVGRSMFALTPRELEVLGLVALGRSNREIAAALFITAKTASIHVSNILGKLGVSGRGEAAAIAHRLGLIEPA